MKAYIKNLIQIIITGTSADVKVAQRQMNKFWHDVYIPNREEGRAAFSAFLETLKDFDRIIDIDHQAYFINTLKWSLWGGVGEDHFEEWAAFFLTHIQHPSGKIRQAVIRATEYLSLICDWINGTILRLSAVAVWSGRNLRKSSIGISRASAIS